MAEFVDNAIQSFAYNREQLIAAGGAGQRLIVSIDIDPVPPGRITVRDNAAGIDLATFPRAFRPAVAPPDRRGLSEFGMGMKSAACWFGSRWHVRTKALEENVERCVRFHIASIVRDELDELTIEEVAASPNAHFTELVLEGLHTIPVGRTVGKIKDHLADIYRVFLRDDTMRLLFNGEQLGFEERKILVAPYYKTPDAPAREWRKEVSFDLGNGQSVSGFAGLLDPGNYTKSGFALFRRGRLIEGSGEEGYRPPLLFGRSGQNSFAALRLFGELHLEGFEVSHTKDGFRWDEGEQPFLELLKEHLDAADLPMLRQCANYRSLAAKKDRSSAATEALNRTSDAIIRDIAEVLPTVAQQPLVETQTTPLADRPLLAARELQFDFGGQPWLINIELVDDALDGDWLSISDLGVSADGRDAISIRVSMTHPFMVSFAQTEPEAIDPILRIAASLALAEKLARRSGVKSAGTVRRNLNQILREAMSKP